MIIIIQILHRNLRSGATYAPRIFRTARFAACKSIALIERTLADAETPLPCATGRPAKTGVFLERGIPGIRLKFSDEPIFKRG